MDRQILFDWAREGNPRAQLHPQLAINDETLREGIQCPSVTEPSIDQKLQIVHLMDQLGIETASMGLPCAGARQMEDAVRLCREIASSKLRLQPNCGGRTVADDVRAIAETSQRSGIAVDAFLFVGSSPIRQIVEQWSLPQIVARSTEAIALAAREGLRVMFITEDTTRSSPEHLRTLLTAAVNAGATRICLCDTAGAAVPEGARNLVRWAIELLGTETGFDWHGHNDRGLGLANALAAADAGCTRIHATALGLGERTGNTPMEQLLVNLKLLGKDQYDLTILSRYVETVARYFEVSIPAGAPVVGRDAFRTATGVHAAAVSKALQMGDRDLTDRVYSGVPASWLGSAQQIEIGPMSGASNIRHFLRSRGLPADPEVVAAVLDMAKQSFRVLSEDEVLNFVQGLNTGGTE